MSLVSDAKARVAKLMLNMQRFDQVMNAGDTIDIPIDNGTVPSLKKLFSQIGIAIKGTVATPADLPVNGNKVGDIYIVSTAGDNNAAGDGYIWNGASWRNFGQLRGPAGPQGPAGPPGTGGAGGKTIKDYGAVMDGVADDSDAWTAMINAEGFVRIGRGVTRLNKRVGSLTDGAGVSYQGAGTKNTIVLLGANGGLNVSGKNWFVDGFKFQADAVVACALRTGTVDNNRGFRITNNEWASPSTTGSGSEKYFTLCLEMNSCWFGRIVNNEFFNWDVSFQKQYGTGILWKSSVNVYFAFNSIVNWNDAYVWSTDQTIPNTNCEGHQIVGNVAVANKRNFYFGSGIYAVLSANTIDLTVANGTVVESYVGCTILQGNWFATQVGSTGGIALWGGDSSIVSGNTFAWNSTTGIQLSIQNVSFLTITGNTFRFGDQAIAANSGCSDVSVTGNNFVGQGVAAVNLNNVTGKLAYSGNVASAPEYLPSTVNQGIIGAGGGSSSSGAKSFTQVFTTQSASPVQEFSFDVSSLGLSQKPNNIAVTVQGDLGYSVGTYYKYDPSTATNIIVGLRRSDNLNIPSGNGIRVGISI